MNAIYGTWLVIAADLALMSSPKLLSTNEADFWLITLGHALVSVAASFFAYLLLPRRYKVPRLAVIATLFCFAFIAPVVGAIGLLLITRISLRPLQESERFAVPVAVDLPVFDVQSKDQSRNGQGAIRSRLHTAVPGATRMQSLLTLQAVPNRVANPILETLLSDNTDDVRLVAFGMLDSQEKKISRQIRQELDRLPHDLTLAQRFDCLRQLAQLNWELVYSGLAQGELRKHIVEQSAMYADQALELGAEPDPGLMFLRCRIFLEQGDADAAEDAIHQAVNLGFPKASAWMLLAEIAFRKRNFAAVHEYMLQISDQNFTSRARAVRDYWLRVDLESTPHDRRFLPHL
ncbi:MAG: hypothetical protein V9E91_14095 [Burkholderiaceae bacterium]